MGKGIKFHIKDFGPISKADIDIKPLTVFIGRNNTGKSYAALLLYSLIKAAEVSRRKRHLYKQMGLEEYIKGSITRQIERVFDNYLKEMINKNSKDTCLQFSIMKNDKGYTFSFSEDEPMIQLYDNTELKDLIFFKHIVLLPSSRSGILHAYKIIAASYLKDADLTKEYPLYGGIADFIHILLKYGDKRVGLKDNGDLLNTFEEIVGGNIIIKDYELYFKDKQYNISIEVSKASSGIQELVPLYLVIKHFKLDDLLLIIEEPEAHLHPALILELVRILALLIRRGAHILITTHSDYLLNKLNLLIRLSNIDRARIGYKEDEYLKPDEVSAYLFKYSPELKSSIAEKLTVEEEGIPEDEFTNVIDELTKTHIKIDIYEGR